MALQRLVMGVAAPIATKNFTMGAERLLLQHICRVSAPIDFVNIAELRNPDHGRPVNPLKIPLKRYSFTY